MPTCLTYFSEHMCRDPMGHGQDSGVPWNVLCMFISSTALQNKTIPSPARSIAGTSFQVSSLITHLSKMKIQLYHSPPKILRCLSGTVFLILFRMLSGKITNKVAGLQMTEIACEISKSQ